MAVKTLRKLGAAGERLPGRWNSVATQRLTQQDVFANRSAHSTRFRTKAGARNADAPVTPAFRRETPGPELCEETWGPGWSKDEAKAFFREASARQQARKRRAASAQGRDKQRVTG